VREPLNPILNSCGAPIAPERGGAVSMRGESWTPERVEMLRKLWSEGETAAVIADRLGVMSRSAVLGKIFRLRLPMADAGVANQKGAATGEPGESIVGPARRRRSAARIRRAKPPVAKATQHKTLLELTNTTCRWPHGRPGTEKFFFCGAPEADLEQGIPYCARHMRRAYPASAGAEEVSTMLRRTYEFGR